MTTETWLAQRLERARVAQPHERAREIMLLMEGAMALTLIHADRRYIEAAGAAARRLVRQRIGPSPPAQARSQAGATAEPGPAVASKVRSGRARAVHILSEAYPALAK